MLKIEKIEKFYVLKNENKEFIKFYEESPQSYEYWTKHKLECSPKMDGSHIPKIEAVREGLFEIFIKEKYK